MYRFTDHSRRPEVTICFGFACFGSRASLAASWATNLVESPFSAARLRTDAARRDRKVADAEELTWKMTVAEKRFRRLNSPELLEQVLNHALDDPT